MWEAQQYYIVNAHFNYKIFIQIRVTHRARLWSSIPTWWLALQVPQISTTEIANLVSFQREGKLLTKASSSFNLSVEMPGARKAALRKDMLAPAAMMQAGFRSIPRSGWKMQAFEFFCKYRRWHSFFQRRLARLRWSTITLNTRLLTSCLNRCMRQIMKMPLALAVNLY